MNVLCLDPVFEGIEHGLELSQNTRHLLSASNRNLRNLCNFIPEDFGTADPISVFVSIFVILL